MEYKKRVFGGRVLPCPKFMVPRREKGDQDLLVAFFDLALLPQQTI